MNPDLILAHTSFLGHTGYAAHARDFFTCLSKTIPTRVRNFTYVDDLSYLTQYQKDLIIHQTWNQSPYEVGTPFDKNKYHNILNIILNSTNHYYFYDEYEGPKIAYNVWESTRQPDDFFQKILEFDQFWVPTQWQKIMTAEQGFPMDKIYVVPEGIDPEIFFPLKTPTRDALPGPPGVFKFFVSGRWEPRKSTEEITRAFLDEFQDDESVQLILNVDNPFPVDDCSTTEERLEKYGLNSPNVVVRHFMPFEEYIRHLQNADCFVSCSRSEGWNLPLIEAIACGIPTICSDYGAQLDFARGISWATIIKGHFSPEKVYGADDVPGTWAEPDYDHLREQMRYVRENWESCRTKSFISSHYIRETFRWENAVNAAMEAISKIEYPEIHQVQSESSIKLNLGCGNDILEGYINVDTFNNTAAVDVDANILDLPFKDESVDEIFISHTMEHMGIYKVPSALIEFSRVLKLNGKLKILVPDLKHCIELFMSFDPKDQYFKQDVIFGGQTHEGDYHKNGFTVESLKHILTCYGFNVKRIESVHGLFYGKEIQCEAHKVRVPTSANTTFSYHFVDGPFIKVDGDDTRYYDIQCYDLDNSAIVHRCLMPLNMWTRPFRKWFTTWRIQVSVGDEVVFKHDFDAKGKRVYIALDSKALGDTIAWFPYVEAFRAKNKCRVIVSTFWNDIFKEEYTQLEFVKPGTVSENLYASYKIGCFDDAKFLNKSDWRETPIQKIASDILGLEYKEMKPKIVAPEIEIVHSKPIVTLSEGSTAGCKQWQHSGGWQQVVDSLRDHGYDVMVISKESTELKNIIDKTNCPIKETIKNLKASEFYMGVSSGPSWLAWALDIPVVMISGCTESWNEFQEGIVRITNEDVCHGCMNTTKHKFDKGSWWWCPTEEDFICTKSITPEIVIDKLERYFF